MNINEYEWLINLFFSYDDFIMEIMQFIVLHF
jgi:hypothetical protein